LAYSRFSHLLRRNKTWDTSLCGAVGAPPNQSTGLAACDGELAR